MKDSIKSILILIGFLVAVILAFSCSPQKRLDRLVKNNPELARDTIHAIRTFTLPGAYRDTNITASVDVTGLNLVLEKYKTFIDSSARAKIAAEIKNYIITRPCLNGPVKIRLSNGGICTIEQLNGIFYCTVNEPPRPVSISVPVIKVTAEIKHSWQWFVAGMFVLLLLEFIIAGVLVYMKK